MANNKEKTYWPHMITGFFIIGISLGYWTVKSASSMPVQKSNEYMEKQRFVDLNINEILVKKMAFDEEYTITLHGKETMKMEDNVHSNRKMEDPIKLTQGSNSFVYTISLYQTRYLTMETTT